MNQPNEVSCILYDGNRPPRFYKFKRNIIHLFFYGLPLISFICILIVIGVSIYFKQIQRISQKRVPEIIHTLQKEKSLLEGKLSQEKLEKSKLIKKLSTPSQEVSKLSLFSESIGRKDISNTPDLDLNTFKLSSNGDDKTLSFNIVNQTENQTRLSGYIFIILKTQNRLHVWPKEALAENLTINFSSGESFVTSRFRPVEASFQLATGTVESIKVVVFNRAGDLMLHRIVKEF